MVVGYSQRQPWPVRDKFTLCAWFVDGEATDRNSLFQGLLIGASVLLGLRGCNPGKDTATARQLNYSKTLFTLHFTLETENPLTHSFEISE